jgi:hypothetical protein
MAIASYGTASYLFSVAYIDNWPEVNEGAENE